MTPGSVQQGPRPQGGQIRQWPTVRQQTPGGGQVVVRPSASGGIQMVGAQPQPQKQIQVPQVINSGGGQPRPLIISGQHPPDRFITVKVVNTRGPIIEIGEAEVFSATVLLFFQGRLITPVHI